MQSDNRHTKSGSQACVLERVTTEHTYEMDHTNVSIALRLDTEMSQQADREWNLNPGLFATRLCWLSVCCGACHKHDFVNPGWVGIDIIPILKSCPGAWGSLPVLECHPVLSLAWLHGFPGGGTDSPVTFSGDCFSHWKEKG